MSDDSILKQIDSWKTKYYTSISELEKQQNYELLLLRGLNRLALIAHGIDPLLDKHLTELRSALRKKADNHYAIEQILANMETAILKMDPQTPQAAEQTTGAVLAELLDSLKFPRALKSQANQLAQDLKIRKNDEIPVYLPKVSTLIEHSLNQQSPSSSSFGFKFNLFKSSKQHTEPDINIPDSKLITTDSSISEDQNDDGQAVPTRLILLQLLERLSLPAELMKRTSDIRHKIISDSDDQQLPLIIKEITDIIHALSSQVVAEKREHEDFLQTLSQKLNQLDQQLRSNNDESLRAFQERQTMGQSVENTVKQLSVSISEDQDLDTTKHSLGTTVDSLNQLIQSYHRSDEDQFNQSQTQIRELKRRIEIMEQESIELRQNAMKSRDQALRDPLTGLWNRQALNEVLEKEYTRWQRYKGNLSLVLWDLDNFKSINDIYGHAAGDKVLKTLASILQSQTRDADFIARYGGEEFIGLFPETTLSDALLLAEKVRNKVKNAKFHYESTIVTVTVSAGIAQFFNDDTIDEVFNRADKALYQAKASGRDRCVSSS